MHYFLPAINCVKKIAVDGYQYENDKLKDKYI